MMKVSRLLLYLKNGKKPPDPKGGSGTPSHEHANSARRLPPGLRFAREDKRGAPRKRNDLPTDFE
jgi:hypothetical protein